MAAASTHGGTCDQNDQCEKRSVGEEKRENQTLIQTKQSNQKWKHVETMNG